MEVNVTAIISYASPDTYLNSLAEEIFLRSGPVQVEVVLQLEIRRNGFQFRAISEKQHVARKTNMAASFTFAFKDAWCYEPGCN